MEKPADRPNFTALVQRLDNVIASNMANMVSTTIHCFTASFPVLFSNYKRKTLGMRLTVLGSVALYSR